MIVISSGQSFAELAEKLTISGEYGPAIAAHNNMVDSDIDGKKFRLDIPDNWVKPEYVGKQVTMPAVAKSAISVPVVAAAIVAALFLLK